MEYRYQPGMMGSDRDIEESHYINIGGGFAADGFSKARSIWGMHGVPATRVWSIRWVRLHLLLFAWLVSLPANAVEKPISAFYREIWTTREGLPHNQVNTITQTPDGYLWLGTWDGLVRYNGLEFQTFDRGNTPILRDSAIRSLSSTADGTVVVGTSRGGVAVLRGNQWTIFGIAQGLAQDEVLDAVLDRGGRLWVATESAGISLLDHGKATQFNAANGMPSDVVYELRETSDGSIWAGTSAGLVRFRHGRMQVMPGSSGLPDAPVFVVVETRSRGLLVGTEQGVYRQVPGSERFERLSPLLPTDGVPSLSEDHAGNLWIGTVNNGLMRLSATGVDRFTSQRGLPNNRVPSLLVDREGSIWAGTNAGLLQLSDAPFGTWNIDQGLSDDYVRTVYESRDGDVWIGTGRGLNLWRDNRVVANYTTQDGLPSDSILSLLQAQDGSLLVGTYTDGVLRMRDGKVVERFNTGNGMPGSNQIRALAEATDGSIWIGTNRGLVRWHHGEYKRFGLTEGLPREFILSLHLARDGSLWVGTSDGVARIVGENVHALDLGNINAAKDVFGFSEDADGTLWMATDRGLVRYRRGHLAGLGIANGMPIDTLFAVVDDGLGYFWLTSNRGVIRVKKTDANAVLDGRRSRIEFDQLGEANGMVSAQCNGGSGPSAMRDSKGRIWVATARGAAMASPASLHAYRQALPHVVLEQIRVNDRPIAPGHPLRLPAGTNTLEFRYAAISFLMPRFLRYRQRLLGEDAGWVERGTMRSVQYTNLRPGHYRFEVGVSAPGLGQGWSTDSTAIDIDIQPHFWQHSWVITAAMIMGLLGLWALVRWRTTHLRRRAVQLEALVELRTSDLKQHAERLRESDLDKSRLLEKLQQQSIAFERMALEDALTGVGNRRSLDTQLQQAFDRALRGQRSLCFALFDIDHFKQVNDQFSHAAGDQALIAVAKALHDALDGAGVLARWGGEEFGVLFERIPLARAIELCETMRKRVEAIDCGDFAPGFRLTVSGGVAEIGEAQRFESLVARADALLYEAKRGGRNRICS